MKKLFVFKEIEDSNELEKYFRLRYEIYSECSNKIFLSENTAKLDVDSFDIRAKHYGFMYENTPVGYFRMIFPEGEFCNTKVIEIAKKHHLQKFVNVEADIAPYPFLSYDGVPKIHWNYYENLIKNDEKIVEVSRLIIQPAYRDMKITKVLTDFGAAIYLLISERIKNLVVNCSKSHEAFYKYYGFNPIDNLGGYQVGDLQKVSLAFSSMSNEIYTKVKPLAQEFTHHGKIEIEL